MKDFIFKRYIWKRMFKNIKNVIEQCELCARNHSKKNYRYLRPVEAKYLF